MALYVFSLFFTFRALDSRWRTRTFSAKPTAKFSFSRSNFAGSRLRCCYFQIPHFLHPQRHIECANWPIKVVINIHHIKVIIEGNWYIIIDDVFSLTWLLSPVPIPHDILLVVMYTTGIASLCQSRSERSLSVDQISIGCNSYITPISRPTCWKVKCDRHQQRHHLRWYWRWFVVRPFALCSHDT